MATAPNFSIDDHSNYGCRSNRDVDMTYKFQVSSDFVSNIETDSALYVIVRSANGSRIDLIDADLWLSGPFGEFIIDKGRGVTMLRSTDPEGSHELRSGDITDQKALPGSQIQPIHGNDRPHVGYSTLRRQHEFS